MLLETLRPWLIRKAAQPSHGLSTLAAAQTSAAQGEHGGGGGVNPQNGPSSLLLMACQRVREPGWYRHGRQAPWAVRQGRVKMASE